MLDARRKAYLAAMGIELWAERGEGPGARGEEVVPPASTADAQATGESSNLEPRSSIALEPSLEESNLFSRLTSTSEPEVSPPSAPGAMPSNLSLEALCETVSTCQICGLHQTRTQTVFGVGDPDARLMIIGEAPGADEDRQGEPFVGRAGQLLNLMLEAIGFRRDQVYIANIIKCRPPGNRDPHAEEAAACQGYLHRQIELIGPDLILSVGRVSAHNLLSTDLAVGRLRGRTHHFQPGDIPLIVTYHPAYLLRRPQEKAKAWQDLQQVHRVLRTASEGS